MNKLSLNLPKLSKTIPRAIMLLLLNIILAIPIIWHKIIVKLF